MSVIFWEMKIEKLAHMVRQVRNLGEFASMSNGTMSLSTSLTRSTLNREVKHECADYNDKDADTDLQLDQLVYLGLRERAYEYKCTLMRRNNEISLDDKRKLCDFIRSALDIKAHTDEEWSDVLQQFNIEE
ncbi:hypothetical protein VPHD483_0071 [Vibrio phage D483]